MGLWNAFPFESLYLQTGLTNSFTGCLALKRARALLAMVFCNASRDTVIVSVFPTSRAKRNIKKMLCKAEILHICW